MLRTVLRARPLATTLATRAFATEGAKDAPKIPAPKMLFGLSGRYATALFSAASQQKSLASVETEMNSFKSMIDSNAELASYLKDPTINRVTKAAMVKDLLTQCKFCETTVNFFVLLAENGRLGETVKIGAAFKDLMSAHRKEVIATVTSAEPLAEWQVEDVTKALAGFVAKDEKILIGTSVKPDILGGLIVRFGDKYIDLSVKTRINSIDRLLKEAV